MWQFRVHVNIANSSEALCCTVKSSLVILLSSQYFHSLDNFSFDITETISGRSSSFEKVANKVRSKLMKQIITIVAQTYTQYVQYYPCHFEIAQTSKTAQKINNYFWVVHKSLNFQVLI